MKEIKYYFMIPLLLLLLLLADVAVVLGFFYCYVFRYTDDSSIDEMDPAYQNATVLDEHFQERSKSAEKGLNQLYQDIMKVDIPAKYEPKMYAKYGYIWEEE